MPESVQANLSWYHAFPELQCIGEHVQMCWSTFCYSADRSQTVLLARISPIVIEELPLKGLSGTQFEDSLQQELAALIPLLKDNGGVKDAECPVGRQKRKQGGVEEGREEESWE